MVLVPGLAGGLLRHPSAHKSHQQEPVRLQQPVQLNEPFTPVRSQVGEDRDRPDQIEARVWLVEWRLRPIYESVERRTHMGLHPADALLVDVAAPDLRLSGLAGEVPQCASSATAEVEDSLAGKRPIGWEGSEDSITRFAAELVVVSERLGCICQ